ncbi:hypothetical protein [Chryseobacterium gambrini]|uniref:Uncharacterized protein n=1 Tax=Chryseobacterium gambrini TaxID=373672 RepID=A0A1N7Q8B4_9FLAO|nr:hypothetical protein [Chryseobacterium gambrini]SIT19092.1 hypothetical protein SAMN05421785_109157 [Chryseobacterium gambrini]
MWKYLKYLWYIILLALFVVFIIYYNKSSDVAMKQSEQYLKNNVEFEGYVTGFEQSNNHAFGVIHLKLTKSNVQKFNKTIKNNIYPYRIQGTIAELYTTIPDGLQKLDVYKVSSNTHQYTITYKSNNKSYTSDLYIIKDPYNIDFVKENTIFK